ncbi:MAG: CHASE2 domain-containing protein, partial [Caulobacteraceae bacterium]
MSRTEFRECLVRAALATLIAALLALADPMGLDEAADRHSADVIARMTAPYYGGKDHAARERIAVVEVTDFALNRNHVPWPPPRSFYTRLLGWLAGGEREDLARPAAIFFDYAFISQAQADEEQAFIDVIRHVSRYEAWKTNPNCQSSPLAKMNCIVANGGVPVILGKNYPPNACLTGESRVGVLANVELAQAAVITPLGWPDLPSRFDPLQTRARYVEALGDNGADPARCDEINVLAPDSVRKRVIDRLAEGEAPPPGLDSAPPWTPLGYWKTHAGAGYDLSPALAMTYAICLRDQRLRDRARAERTEPPAEMKLCGLFPDRVPLDSPAVFDQPSRFEITDPVGPVWGSVADPATDAVRGLVYPKVPVNKACGDERRNPLRAARVGWSQLTAGLGAGAEAVAVPCPYHLTIDVDVFFDIGDEDLEAVRDRLQGRAVAIGAAQALTNDWIATTLNARQAGVHYHAMAADNLLTFGADLPRQPPAVFPWALLSQFDWGDVLELACLFVIAFRVELARKRVDTNDAPGVWPARKYLRTYWRHRVEDARAYWPTAQAQRHRIWQVTRVFGWALAVLVVSVIVTALFNWAPLNLVGVAGFTVLFVAFELWSHTGWGAVIGLVASVLILLPRRVAGWFSRPRRPGSA